MLMISSTVGMINWVHCYTTSLGPRVTLDGELVLSAGRLEERFVGSSTTSNNTDHTTRAALDDLLCAGWELDTGLALVRVVANDGNVVARCASKGSTVSRLLLDIRDNGSFGDGGEGENVSDSKGCVLAGVDELTSVHALVCDEGLGVKSELVRVSEGDSRERRSSSWIMNDLLYDTSDVANALRKVESSELGGVLVKAGVGREDRAAALPLIADNSPHVEKAPKI